MFLASRYRDRAGFGIDTVLNKFGDGLQRIALRKRNYRDRIPVVADLELAARSRPVFQVCRHGGIGMLPQPALFCGTA